ncbi:hypothetical protein SAMN04488540_12337 [Ferrimonas sediminum]|uniref:Uncharacterized protein n=1 Tax=Ferrimonas sediminum TaxID=718193 RepID=A0A1G9AGZ3_9GAMM|nr:hypothetical protein [Ferrimonas sediminum]SDK26548.1 hypothetical protein SAMN04488540_12337 [Ferrimonas sediminum]
MRFTFLVLLSIALLKPTASTADIGKGIPIMSFYELQEAIDDYDMSEVNMAGYFFGFSYGGGKEYYLCISQEACLYASNQRVRVGSNKELGPSFEHYVDCHVIVTGKFKTGRNLREMGRVLGEIVEVHQLSLSVSRLDYSSFNSRCKAWNNIESSTRENFPDGEFEKMMSDRAY